MKLEQKLRPDKSQTVICEVTHNSAMKFPYNTVLDDSQKYPYIYTYVKGKLWQ